MDAKLSLHVPTSASAVFVPTDWSKAYHNSQFQELVRFKSSRIKPAVIIYFFTYVMLSCMAGFAPSVMSIKLIGSFSLGYALILFTYITAWAIALWYVRVADVEFDPLKNLAIKSIEMEGIAK
jgi:uncharacterized membrane protein (DUF485 family)